MSDDGPLADALGEAITPSAADIARAIEILVDKLAHGPIQTETAVRSVILEFGAPLDVGYEYDAGSPDNPTVDRDAPLLAHTRARQAARFALARMVAAGTTVEAGYPPHVSVNVRRGNSASSTTGPITVKGHDVVLAQAYSLAPGLDSTVALPLASIESWTAEAGPLLSPRAVRTLHESLRAARRGLHQAALSMLGTVCEGAWYVVAEALRDQDEDLARNLDLERTAQVQRCVRDVLGRVRKQSQTASELYAHASYLRDLRNYAVHPADENESLEHAFTESAVAFALLETQRHLVRLLVAARAAGAQL